MAEIYINRTLEKRVETAPKNKAIVLFGARQVGKTTLIRYLFHDRKASWYTGDRYENVSYLTGLRSDSDFRLFLSGKQVVVIDEAQRIPGVGLLLKQLVDEKTGCQIVVTGSSSLELAGGVMESAAGRLWPLKLYSLSLGELVKEYSWADVIKDIPDRLVLGSYPEVVLNPEIGPDILTALYESALFKDIFAFGGVKKNDNFSRLLRYLAQNIGSVVSAESLARESGLSRLTVENYINLLEQCFIIKQVYSYSNNLANELKKSRKIYFYDVGVRNAVLDDFTPFNTRSDGDRGALWENFIFMERLKLHEYRRDNTRMFFWRDRLKHEVDIIEESGGNLTAIECKLKDESIRFPNAFRSKYPQANLMVATRANFHNLFL